MIKRVGIKENYCFDAIHRSYAKRLNVINLNKQSFF